MTMARTARAKDAPPHDAALAVHRAVITLCDVLCCWRAAKQTRRVAAKDQRSQEIWFLHSRGPCLCERSTPPFHTADPRDGWLSQQLVRLSSPLDFTALNSNKSISAFTECWGGARREEQSGSGKWETVSIGLHNHVWPVCRVAAPRVRQTSLWFKKFYNWC